MSLFLAWAISRSIFSGVKVQGGENIEMHIVEGTRYTTCRGLILNWDHTRMVHLITDVWCIIHGI